MKLSKEFLALYFNQLSTGFSFIFSGLAFAFSWYSVHSKKLADTAQSQKDEAFFKLLQQISNDISKNTQNSTNLDVQDVITTNILDSTAFGISSDVQTNLAVGFGLLLISFLFINSCRINNNSTLPTSNKDDLTSRIEKDADNYSKSCLPENFNSCDPALRGDVSSSLQDVASALSTANNSINTQMTEFNTKLAAFDRSVNSQLGVRSLMLNEELIKVSAASEKLNVSVCKWLKVVLGELDKSFGRINEKLQVLNTKVDLSNTEAIALKSEIQNLTLKRGNEIVALASEIESKLPELLAKNPQSMSTFDEIGRLCTSIMSYFS